MRLFKFLAAVLALCAFSPPARAIDPFFPTFGNQGIDVVHYNLDLDVNPATGELDAKAILRIRALKRLTRFRLDLAGLTVSRVTVYGEPASFSHANDKLVVTPQRPIPESAEFRVVVDYSGVPETIQDPTAPGDPYYQLGWFRYGVASYVVSEPVGASTFFPANDEVDDKATFAIAVTVPAAFEGVANGALASVEREGVKKRYLWQMPEPMTTWLATVHVNKFRLDASRAPDGTPIRVYATAATSASDVAGYRKAGPMLAFLEGLIGPYPFASYGSVVVDDPVLYYALETQAMSTFPLGAADEEIVMHELAHSWFGNSVSVAKWEDLWIAEGGATYFEILWPLRNNPSGFDSTMRSLWDLVKARKVGPAVVDRPEEMFTDRTYYRGALALYALRLEVGEATFYRILRTFLSSYRGRNASSQDFIRIAMLVSGRPAVRELLTAWLYEKPVPRLPDGTSVAKGSPVPLPNLVGSRCGPGGHRGAPRVCAD